MQFIADLVNFVQVFNFMTFNAENEWEKKSSWTKTGEKVGDRACILFSKAFQLSEWIQQSLLPLECDTHVCVCGAYPLAEVAGEDEVSGEGVGEGCVELQHFE